ncbi:hypothetical protein [Azospirillum sp. B2RO_4]|uniref:hypothetical protein n=1 Tax=Azospirillum sp. B2RO_4 TaxID=3027796 RepID=UPI003DA9F66D
MSLQPGDGAQRDAALAHVGQRRRADDVIAMAGAQHLQEIQPALRPGGLEGGEAVVAELVQTPLAALWRAPVSSR